MTAVAVRSEPLIEDPREYGSTMTATFDVTPPSGTYNPETKTDPFAADDQRMQRGEPPPEAGAARIRIDASVVWMRIGRQILQISAFEREDDRAPAGTGLTVLNWASNIRRVTDDEMNAVQAAAAPVHPLQRDAFLKALAVELERHPIVGPGLVG